MSLSRASQQPVVIPVVDAVSSPKRKSGLSAFTVQISKDGGSFATSTNTASELGSTGRYVLTLTAAETAAGTVHIYAEQTNCLPVDMSWQTYGLADGVVTGSPSATSITASGQTESATDFWKGAFLRFTSGSLAGQVRQVTGYSTGVFTTNAFTSAPSAGDRYVIVNA